MTQRNAKHGRINLRQRFPMHRHGPTTFTLERFSTGWFRVSSRPNHTELSGWITPELHRDNPHFIGAKINFLVQTYIVSKTYVNRFANAFYG